MIRADFLLPRISTSSSRSSDTRSMGTNPKAIDRSVFRTTTDRDLATVCLKALETEPDDRYASTLDFCNHR